MTDAYVVAIEGLEARPLETLPAEVKRAALRAVNRVAEKTRTSSARKIREQVAFPARYLSGRDGRLTLTKAKTAEEGAEIRGRFRPTSLARFATSGTPGKSGVRVEVAPGFARFMRRAFLIKLRSGGDVDTKSNLGLAIRLRPGEKIQNKTVMVPLKPGSNLYLLYGPAVNQVFRSVAEGEADEAGADLEREFLRLLELDL